MSHKARYFDSHSSQWIQSESPQEHASAQAEIDYDDPDEIVDTLEFESDAESENDASLSESDNQSDEDYEALEVHSYNCCDL